MAATVSHKSILIIEDNHDIATLISVNLSGKHRQIDHADDGEVGLDKALNGHYDLVILDLMLPGMDGLEICRVLRHNNNFVPILMLTAKTSELDRVLGLEVGADDYLTKPFSVPELVARVNAMLRRAETYQPTVQEPDTDKTQLQFGDLQINAANRQVTVAARSIDLTAKEFDLLWYFASNAGRVFTRAQLLDNIWGYGHEGYEHTVNSHINRLRSKLESNAAKPRYILTVWGVGYKFANEPQMTETP